MYIQKKEDKAYKKALIDLGIDLNSDFALFNLNTTEITFRGQCGEIYNVCWFKIYSNDLSYGIERQAVLGIPSEYLPLDSFEGEGGFSITVIQEKFLKLNWERN